MTKYFGSYECDVCGGTTSRSGFAYTAHDRSARHIAALRERGQHVQADRLQREREHVELRRLQRKAGTRGRRS